MDSAIISAADAGKDIVLTGNPGDGKTHIIRMMKSRLEELGKPIEIVLDASTLSNTEIYEKWVSARNEGKVYVIAINAAVLYSVYREHSDFAPIANAYRLMASSVVFHNESDSPSDIIVFDLSKREILTPEILTQAIKKLTDSEHYQECDHCPLRNDCDVTRNRILLNGPLFQERLSVILERVALKGYHATLRELQSFIAYLILGNRSCKKLSQTAGNDNYDICNLVYSGKGDLFVAIRASIDPIRISHPVWDERIIQNDIEPESWTDGYKIPAEAIAFDNDGLFRLRKRQFYFFNAHGDELLKILDDEASRFQSFLLQDDKKTKKELFHKINTFFGSAKPSNTEIQIWTGHRFDNEPRKVLISIGAQKASSFEIGKPALQADMQTGIDMTSNYIRLEKKNARGIFLKIDFDMYLLLSEAERGVPVLFLESDLVKKVWRFIEQLQSFNAIEDENAEISLMDVQNKKRINVTIDREDNKYTAIRSIRTEEA